MNVPPGRILGLHLCRGDKGPMASPAEVAARADFGLEGDRHARFGSRRQILLADAAVLAAEGLEPGRIRENLTVGGMAVDGLAPGTRLRCGAAVILRVTGPCEPCDFLETLRPGLRDRMKGRRGTLATVEAGGTIRVGDAVVLA